MQLNELRTSLFGLNKTDVCEYISQLNAVYEQKEQQIRQEQREITETLGQKNEELNRRISVLEQEKTELVRERDAMQNEICRLREETEAQKKRMEHARENAQTALEQASRWLRAWEEQLGEQPNGQSGETEDER